MSISERKNWRFSGMADSAAIAWRASIPIARLEKGADLSSGWHEAFKVRLHQLDLTEGDIETQGVFDLPERFSLQP